MIVTVVAYKRPELLKRCLESIAKADLSHVSEVIVSLDRHSDEMAELMYRAIRQVQGPIGIRICDQAERLGIHNHQRYVFNQLFASKLLLREIVALEEDSVVGHDTFEMAYWGLKQPNVSFVNLGFNCAQRASAFIKDSEDADHQNMFGADVLHQDNELRSSHGWAFTNWFWRDIEPFWNGKTRAPYGWDWQVTYLCYVNGWKCLTPELSRVINTGREGGTYETPSTWDETRKPVPLCDVSRPVSYKLVAHSFQHDLPGWVKEEMQP